MADATNLDDELEIQCNALSQVQIETAFIKCRNTLKDEFICLRDSVSDISRNLDLMKKQLDIMKENNEQYKKLSLSLQEWNKKILLMQKNVPQKLVEACFNNDHELQNIKPISNVITQYEEQNEVQFEHSYLNSAVKNSVQRDCKRTLFNEPEEYPSIPDLTEEEFDAIPKYIIGRQSLQNINTLISSINQVLKAKYSLLSIGKAAARKKGKLDLYLYYQQQQIICQNSGGTHFFTAEDYERHVKLKLDKTALNLMVALRHCKRIREYRLKKEVYYFIM